MANNPLYKNIQINQCLLKTWEDKFIFSDIMDSSVYYNANQHKYKGYVTELNDGNFENNLNTAIASIGKERDHIHTCCIYSDIDNQCQNPTLQLLFAIANIKPIVFITDQPISTTISYCSNSPLVPLND